MSSAVQPVWDLHVRLFHWLLAALIGLSWWTAENDELEIHMYSGFAILTLIIFRLLWGVFGSSTARFRNFVRGPRAVLAHIRDSRAWKAAGHNPLGALSVIAMLVVLKLQVATGLVNADDDGLAEGPLAATVGEAATEFAHQAHNLLFDLLLVLIALHLAAILFYLLDRRNLVGPMVTGKAPLDASAEPMRPGKWWVALLCLVAAIALTRWVIAGAPPFGA
ncbi:MAG: cytochrome b/b6 domain-containing protein, partial [Sphingomicrobium sp.]